MDKLEILSKIYLFNKLDHRVLWHLADITSLKKFHQGATLIEQNKKQDAAYIILEGKVIVKKLDKNGVLYPVAELGPGEIVGEMSLIDSGLPSATVIALENLSCLEIPNWDFRSILQSYPEIALHLLLVLVKRLRNIDKI